VAPIRGHLQAQHAEERESGQELPEEGAVGDLPQEPAGPAAQDPRGPARPGPGAGRLAGGGGHDGQGDQRVQGGPELGFPDAGHTGELGPGQRRAGHGERAARDQRTHPGRGRHRPAQPASRPAGLPAGRRGLLFGGRPGQQHSDGHPGAEPDHQRRQRALEPQREPRVLGQNGKAERGSAQHGKAGQQPAGPAGHVRRPRRAAAAGGPGEDGCDQRQHEIEGNLHDQAPGLGQPDRPGPRPPGMRVIVLDQQQVLNPGPGVPGVRRVEPQQGDGDHRPVRGQDAQRPAAQVGAQRHSLLPGQRGRRPRPVQQKPGQREEDRHADVAAAQRPGHRGSGHRVPGEPADVGEQHGTRRGGPQAVQRSLMPARRRACHGRASRAGPGGNTRGRHDRSPRVERVIVSFSDY